MQGGQIWMESYFADLARKKPWEIALPGAHESGFFSDRNLHWAITAQPFKDNHHYDLIGEKPQHPLWFRCQELDIYQQLKAGIRCLDWRVGVDRTTGQFAFVHCGVTADGQELSKGLQDVMRFVQETRRELVLIRIRTDDTDVSAAEQLELRRQVLSVLKDVLVKFPDYLLGADPRGSLQNDAFNLENLTAQGSRVWLLSSACRDTSMQENSNYIWCGENDYIDGTWKGYQSDFVHTPCEKIDLMKTDLPNLLATRDRQAIFKYADFVIWTINLQEAAVSYIYPQLTKWLSSGAMGADVYNNLNVVNLDYFNQMPGILESIVKINKSPRGAIKVTPAALRSPAPRPPAAGPAGDYAGLVPGARSAAPFYNVGRMRKMLADQGLDWHQCINEFRDAGNRLTPSLVATLAEKGIAQPLAQDFLDWYQHQGEL